MKTFFILSLPRSRTAWLANFLTYENSFCFHEGLLHVGTPFQLEPLFQETHKPFVGNSDCGNVFFVDEIRDTFPEAKFVMIERPLGEVLVELRSLGDEWMDEEFVLKAYKHLQIIKHSVPHLAVNYDQLGEENCEAIWKYCIGTPFDRTRWRMLDSIDMQISLKKKLEQIRSAGDNVRVLAEGMH